MFLVASVLIEEIDLTDLIHSTNIYSDNQGAIASAKNPQFQALRYPNSTCTTEDSKW